MSSAKINVDRAFSRSLVWGFSDEHVEQRTANAKNKAWAVLRKSERTLARLDKKLRKYRQEKGFLVDRSSHRQTLHDLKAARERGDAKTAKRLWAKAKKEARKRMDTRAAIKREANRVRTAASLAGYIIDRDDRRYIQHVTRNPKAETKTERGVAKTRARSEAARDRFEAAGGQMNSNWWDPERERMERKQARRNRRQAAASKKRTARVRAGMRLRR